MSDHGSYSDSAASAAGCAHRALRLTHRALLAETGRAGIIDLDNSPIPTDLG
jgi:hypothetical protein